MAFLNNKPLYTMKTSPYNPKGTTVQLHEVDTGTETPKIPFYRFFLPVKLSSHFRKTKQRNEQRQHHLGRLSYSLNRCRTYIIDNTKAKSMSNLHRSPRHRCYSICNINSLHTKSRDNRVSNPYLSKCTIHDQSRTHLWTLTPVATLLSESDCGVQSVIRTRNGETTIRTKP